jgi:hypothetical protein
VTEPVDVPVTQQATQRATEPATGPATGQATGQADEDQTWQPSGDRDHHRRAGELTPRELLR